MVSDGAKKLIDIVNFIGNNFHVDDKSDDVGGFQLNHRSIAFAVANYVLAAKMLLSGDPSAGKSILANLTGSVMGHLPLNLLQDAQLNGHPFTTDEKIIGRPDYGQLNQGKEYVIFQNHTVLPFLVIDELNRLREGQQDILLNSLETGIWSYLNASVHTGNRACFATINYLDRGNTIIIPPLVDRFDICLSKSILAWDDLDRKEAYNENMDTILRQDITQTLDLMKSQGDTDIKRKHITELREAFYKHLLKEGVPSLSDEERKQIRKEIRAMELSPHAYTFACAYEREINYCELYGEKRSCDPVVKERAAPQSDQNDKDGKVRQVADKNYAGVFVKNPFGNRAQSSVRKFAQAVAYMSGSEKVEPDHLIYVLPYCTGHRFEFDQDFKASHEKDFRKTDMQTHLAQIMADEVGKRYTAYVDLQHSIMGKLADNPSDLKAGIASLSKDQRKTLEEDSYPLIVRLREMLGQHGAL